MSSWRCFPFVDSAPRAYRLKASNAAPSSSTSTGPFRSGKRLRDPQQLLSDQWLSLPMTRHRDSFAHVVARQLASAGLDDVPVMAIDSMTAQKRLIEAGIGIALLPESSVHEELRLGTLRTIDVSHLQTTVPIHVLYRKNGYLTGASRALLTLISNAAVRPSSSVHRNRKRK